MEDFLESIVLIFGQDKYINIKRFWTMFRHKTRVFSLQKMLFSIQWLYNIYLTKAKNRTLSLFTKITPV